MPCLQGQSPIKPLNPESEKASPGRNPAHLLRNVAGGRSTVSVSSRGGERPGGCWEPVPRFLCLRPGASSPLVRNYLPESSRLSVLPRLPSTSLNACVSFICLHVLFLLAPHLTPIRSPSLPLRGRHVVLNVCFSVCSRSTCI